MVITPKSRQIRQHQIVGLNRQGYFCNMFVTLTKSYIFSLFGDFTGGTLTVTPSVEKTNILKFGQ